MGSAQEAARYRIESTGKSSLASSVDMPGWIRFARHAEESGIDSVLISFSRSAGQGDFSPGTRGTTADRGRPGRDLSSEPARRRVGRVSRWDDADSRVADSDV
jgi:hypothetical protein